MNIILIVVDTLRADHLGCYGYFRDTSPTIDNLAQNAVLFDDYHASAVATGPAFTSIVTGLFAINHKFYFTPFDLPNEPKFDDSIPTLAEIIQQNGDHITAVFDNLLSFSSHMTQTVRGCNYVVNPARGIKPYPASIDGRQVNCRLLPWLAEHAQEDFFAMVHYWDPHTPYIQPEAYRGIYKHQKGDLSDLQVKRAPAGYDFVQGWGQVDSLWEEDTEQKAGLYISTERTIDLYDGAIKYTDSLISEVVDKVKELGLLDDTVIMITADHGELLGQHGIYGHTGVYEANTHVPLIIHAPRLLPQGKRIAGYAGHIDIAPTILELLGAQSAPIMDGKSLVSAIMGSDELRKTAFLEFHTCRGLIKEDWKYILPFIAFEKGVPTTRWGRGDGEQLYDLNSDPMETINLINKNESKRKELREQLELWVEENLRYRSDPIVEAVELRDRARKEHSYKHGFATALPWREANPQ